MKKQHLLRRTLLMLFAAAALVTGATAVEETYTQRGSQAVDELKGAMPPEAKEVTEDFSLLDAQAGTKGLESLWSQVKGNLFSVLRQALRSASKIFAVVLLCGFAQPLLSEGSIKSAISLCTVAAVAALSLGDVKAFFGMGVSTLQSLSDFSKVLLPSMCAAAASAGAITSATVKYAASVMFVDILINVGCNIILPMIAICLATMIAGAALEKEILESISKLLQWCCKTLLVLMVTAFTAYLGFSGIIAGKTDELAARVTKSAISTMLPVVGSIVADAAGTVVAGAGLIRNAVGVLGMLAVAAVCVMPFLALGSHYLIFKLTAAMTAAITDKRIAGLIDGIAWAFGMLLALVGTASLMLFISAVSSMRAVSGI